MRYKSIRLSRLERQDRDFIYGASRMALGNDVDGREAREYLSAKRGVDVETIARFRLGYVPFSITSDPAYNFAGRVVLPIFNAYDSLLALSVRPIRDDLEVEQKYWNESFSKGDHLYGLNIAKYSIAAWDFVIVVEGQFDVLKMHAHGMTNTVGIMGGAFTPIHANVLKMWTQNIVFMMDGDKAGSKHAAAAKDVMDIYAELQAGRGSHKGSRLRSAFVELGDGLDPASYLSKNGGRPLRQAIASEMESNNIKVVDTWLCR